MASRDQTKEYWTSILAKFAASGKSAKKWCTEEGISYQSFLSWRKKIKNLPSSPFLELQEVPSQFFELHWDGIKIVFSQVEDLRKLARCLKGLC